MRCRELEHLIEEYKSGTSKEDKLVLRKLEAIAVLLDDCAESEFTFAGEITAEFCRIIDKINNKMEKDISDITFSGRFSGTSNFVPFVHEKPVQMNYHSGYHLLGCFYDHFKSEHELSYFEINVYKYESDEERKYLTNSTLLDYIARINTFASRYLYELIDVDTVRSSDVPDDIIFVYNNLEFIIPRFSTKDENGETVKKKLNIRSALKKLNRFKCETEVIR